MPSLAAFGGDAAQQRRGPGSIPIWTTTPWTLPANQAVALHPELEYALVSFEGPAAASASWWRATSSPQVTRRWGIEHFEELAVCRGAALEGLACSIPSCHARCR
jgi:isoleucyl-tRNA synthetase